MSLLVLTNRVCRVQRLARNAVRGAKCISVQRRKRHYRILGVESSCDETGAAVVDSDRNILGESIHSQKQLHLDLGGIQPPVAFRMHKQNVDRIVNEAVERSNLTFSDLDAFAVTVKPGLQLSLKVGLNCTRRLAKRYGKPLIPIHHMEAHALVVRLLERVEFPFLVLLISGGHCQIALVRSISDFLLLGTTEDTSPGEMLDKLARRLKLKNIPACSRMSGGEAVEYVAKGGDAMAYEFAVMLSRYLDCNFSFSGLKSYSMKTVEQQEKLHGIEADGIIPTASDLCASVQFDLTRRLVNRVQRAMVFCRRLNYIPDEDSPKALVVAGGVASNQYIRKGLELLCNDMGYRLFCPPPRLCTDNGVMIAWNGMERFMCGLPQPDIDSIEFESKSPLGEDISGDVVQQNIRTKTFQFKLKHDDIVKHLQCESLVKEQKCN